MSLEPPSPASSTRPREVERSLQTAPQLLDSLPMTSPPETERHHDATESSRVTPLFKRLQTRFRKNRASQPPNQHSAESGQPANLRFGSQSQLTAHIARAGPSTVAEGRRRPVSVFFFGRDKVCGMSDEAPQNTVGRRVKWVRCSVSLLAPLLSCAVA